MGHALRAFGANDDEPRLDLGDNRLSVLLSARIQSGSSECTMRLRNVSSTGARLEGAVIPPVGSIVRFSRGDVSVSARVVWAGKTSFEIEFRETIDETELLIPIGGRRRTAGPPQQAPFPIDPFVDCDDEDEGISRLPISRH